MLTVAAFLLALGILVAVHEYGHYRMAVACGVKVLRFSVGFGKELLGWTDKRGTRWKLSSLPLGGYVQFAGDLNAASVPAPEEVGLSPQERARIFHFKPIWQRSLIVLAGPLTNLAVAVAIFAAFNLAYGKIVASPVVAGFAVAVAMIAGFALAAWAIQLGVRVTDEWGFREFFVLQVARGLGTMLAMIAAQQWRDVLDGLNALRNDKQMTVILLAHNTIKRFDSPEVEPFDRYQPKLQERSNAVVREWADAVMFANYKTIVKKDDVGFNKTVARGISSGERMLFTTERPAYMAKNRYNLPDSIPLTWDAFANAIK